MSAQFEVLEYHDSNLVSVSTVTAETGLRNTDTSAAYGSFPVRIPDDAGSGSNYSYELWVKLYCAVAPNESCSDFVIWKDFNSVVGTRIYMGPYDSTPANPKDAKSSYAIHTCEQDYYDRANALSWDSTNVATAVGNTTDFMVIQLEVTAAAITAAVSNSGIFHFGYVEA
uniref:Uncharacterized protein n=1 Tax=viral metagenome TaxID=1070528 RepID=A0A6M3IVK3_9ZZZZ